MESAYRLLNRQDLLFVAVVNGAYSPAGDSAIPIYTGKTPGLATTYITDGSDIVLTETFGLPPLHCLRQ
jgi:hypothetical protein